MELVKLIVFSGTDGSGKSTHAKILYRHMRAKGAKVRYVWLRFFSFTTYLLFLYARLAKKSVTVCIDKSEKLKFKVHVFWLDPALRVLYPRLLLFDLLTRFFIELLYTHIKRLDLLIVDRFFIDALVDLVYDIRDCSFLRSLVAKTSLILVNKYSRNHIVFLVDPRVAVRRKSDIMSFKEINCKHALYKILAKNIGVKLWDTTEAPISLTSRVVFEYFHNVVGL